MARVWKEETGYRQPTTAVTLAQRVAQLEEDRTIAERSQHSQKTTKQFRFPFKWRTKFSQAKRKKWANNMLVIYFNKKNEIEPPKFMPIYDGNMVIWKNKPYEFDPRAIWKIKGVKGTPMVYCIKEIDRRPIKNPDGTFRTDMYGRKIYSSDASISNMDVDQVRMRGDSTESDEFLIKAALKAQTSQTKKAVSMGVVIFIALIVIGGLIWFLSSG
jgi:hypothetical protein